MAKAIQEYSLPELMTRIEEIFNANPDPIKGFEAIVQYDIHGEAEGTYQHYFHDGALTIKEGVDATPNVSMALTYDNFKKFLLGKQSGTMALLTGKVKAKGDISTGMKIESILRKYKIKEPL
ncbi:SCP2 sterol-binding domain-containing protein [Neobacillus pocheonensis]|uniref:SCP2 sterol-binding domain-containing protein n=1 Tax=Neobacillus pocheonensis TaxID=363869 RepID=UPI003D2C37BB